MFQPLSTMFVTALYFLPSIIHQQKNNNKLSISSPIFFSYAFFFIPCVNSSITSVESSGDNSVSVLSYFFTPISIPFQLYVTTVYLHILFIIFLMCSVKPIFSNIFPNIYLFTVSYAFSISKKA